MRIYAVRDRLIDYYMLPFCAPGDHQVQAALATQVNAEDANAIAQAPHQFELWRLGEVNDQTSQITPSREYICDLSSLIRPGRKPAAAGTREIPGISGRLTGAPGAPREGTDGDHRPTTDQAEAAPGTRT